MMIHSLRPALAVGTALIAALLILFFGNRMKPNVRESITMAASVIMAGIVSVSYTHLIITFDVNREDQDEVIIELNGMKNKLSSQKAPYPNNNYTFTYILTAEEDGGGIKSILTEGDYEIENLRVYTMDMPAAQIIMPVSYSDLKKNTVFEGIIDMEESGYFVTSFPYKEGYEITVDGKMCIRDSS